MTVYKLYKDIDYFPQKELLEEYKNDVNTILDNITSYSTISSLHKMFYRKLTKRWQYQTADYMIVYAYKLFKSSKSKPKIRKPFLIVPLRFVNDKES